MTPEEKKIKAAKYKQWRDANKEKLNAKYRETYAANQKEIRARKNAWYQDNKETLEKKRAEKREKTNARKRELYAANKEQIQQKKAEYRAMNREKFRKYATDWYNKNKDTALGRSKSWKASNPDKIASYVRNRQAAKLQRTPCWITAKQLKQIEHFYAQAKKLEFETGIRHHVDHIIPLQGKMVSGLHVPENLTIITAKQNLRKNNKFSVDLQA
jgi:hypothetical protein